MDILKNIPNIDPDRNYWLVRTKGGTYFQDFHLNNYIAIGWDKVNNLSILCDETRKVLMDTLKAQYPSRKEIEEDEEVVLLEELTDRKKSYSYGLIANQLIRFTREMKKGDIVIIPSENSKHVAYGEILEDDIYLEDINTEDLESNECPYIKRRKVNWIKYQKKHEIDIYLYQILNSHHSITSANDYSSVIDRTIYPFYIKGEHAYLTMKVNQERDISGVDIGGFVYNTISLVDSYNESSGEKFNKRDVVTKINVQSAGIIEFIGPVAYIACIALGAVVILGGETSFLGIKLKTDGVSKTILEWVKTLSEMKKGKGKLDSRQQDIIDTAENLKITTPYDEQLKNIIKESTVVIEENALDKEKSDE